MQLAVVSDLAPDVLWSRLRGWLLARVLVVTVFLGAVAITLLSTDPDSNFPLRSITGLIVVAYLFSIASAYAVSWTNDLRSLALAQVGADILFITTAVFLTGALESPMAVWYNLAIIGAAILLSRRGAYGTATLATLTYGAITYLVYYQGLPSPLG